MTKINFAPFEVEVKFLIQVLITAASYQANNLTYNTMRHIVLNKEV